MPKKSARRGVAKVSVKAKPKTPYTKPVYDKVNEIGWDRKKTLQQNYATMKVVSDVNKQELQPDPEGVPREPAPVEAIVPDVKLRFYPMSDGKMAELRPLIRKYGDDADKMARDRKLNAWQHTPAQLRKLISHFHETEEHRRE
jgi:hypothetical protein